MYNLNFSEINKDNRKKIILKCKNDNIVDYAIKMVNYNKELPLIEVQSVIINDNNTLIYDTTNCIKLYEKIEENNISVKELLQIIDTILFTLINLKNFLLNSNNLLLNKECVFYNYLTKEIELIYLPFINEVNSAYMEQKIFLLDLLLICKKFKPDCRDLDIAIKELRDDTATLELIKEKLDLVKNEVGGIKSDNEVNNKGLFSLLKKEKRIEENKNSVIKDNALKANSIDYLNLVIYEGDKVKTVKLNRETYLLGRLEGVVDIVIKNSSIGRIHGRIEREDYYYYYIDLESKNGSFINGERVKPNRRYPLENGDNIKIANINMYLKDNRSI